MKKDNGLKILGVLVLVITMSWVGLGLPYMLSGCATTTQYPDGRIVTEGLDPEIVAAFVNLGISGLELAAAKQGVDMEEPPPEPDGDPNIVADLLEVQAIATEIEKIREDGVTEEERERLIQLYNQTSALLRRWGVNVKLNVRK